MSELNVWMNGELVAVWSRSRTGVHRLTYEKTWVQSPFARSLSLSLPIGATREISGDAVSNYFENLLPDSDVIRRRLSARFRTPTTEAFDLLTELGRDCVGAVQLLPPSTVPPDVKQIERKAISDTGIERLLNAVVTDPMPGVEEDLDAFRISIAGVQEKTALLRIKSKWYEPRGATPTTHILKLPLGLVGAMQADLSESIENEWLCGQILRELGFSVARSELAVFGATKVLVVERFDRQWMDNGRWLARLPQEDFCQALGVSPQKKYERDGGPGMREGLKLLSGSTSPNADREQFLLAQLAFWLLAAIDGHAKNFSVSINRGDAYHLTPLYDVLSAWPIIGRGANQLQRQRASLAMGIRSKNMHYRIAEIHAGHFLEQAARSGVPNVRDRMLTLIANVPAALDAVEKRVDRRFPAVLWEKVSKGMLSQAGTFRKGIASFANASFCVAE